MGPAVFGTATEVHLEGATFATSAALMRRTQRIWTDFAKGRKLSEVMPGWPAVKPESPSVKALLMGEKMRFTAFPTAQCADWEAAESAIGNFATAHMCGALMC